MATVGAVVGVFLLLQLAVFVFLQPLIGQVIRSSVSYFSDDLYEIDFKKLRVQLFRKAIRLEDIRLTYDTARVHQSASLRQSKHYTGTVRHIKVNLHEFTYFLSGRYLAIDNIAVDQPVVYAHHFAEATSDSTPSDTTSLDFDTFRLIKPYFDSVNVTLLLVKEASVGIIEHRSSRQLDTIAIGGVNVRIEQAFVDSIAASQTHGWPLMEEFTLAMRDQMFAADSLYDYHVDSVDIDPLRGTLLVKQFSVVPQWDQYEMGEHLGKLVNWTKVDVSRIAARGINFASLTDSLMIRADEVAIAQADFTMFRDLRLPSGEPQYRPLLQEVIQSVSTPFHVDTITVEASTIQYEERRDSTDRAGRITFKDVYASFYNATNRPRDEAAVLKADVRTRLMGEGDAVMHFTFPLASTEGEHHITGTMDRMSLDALNPTAEPLAFVSVKSGVNNRMDFDMRLDGKYATGNVRFQYENLKLSLLEKGAPDNKKGIKSWLANLLVVKSSNPVRTKPLRPGPIAFERDTTRSMFNYWWRALRSGLEVSVGVKKPPQKTSSASTASSD